MVKDLFYSIGSVQIQENRNYAAQFLVSASKCPTNRPRTPKISLHFDTLLAHLGLWIAFLAF